MQAPLRVMIVDDSQTTRELLAEHLARESDLLVVATSPDPLAARRDFLEHEPDVLLLDVVMPMMSGLDFLEKIMSFRPIPVIIYTGRSQPELIRDALQRGAWAVVHKPTGKPGERFPDVAKKLVSLIRQTSPFQDKSGAHQPVNTPSRLAVPIPSPPAEATVQPPRKVIAIGASTGGPAAIQEILRDLSPEMPPIVIAIHMPPRFTRSYAQRLDQMVALRVREATDGETLENGTVLIAPGNTHFTISGTPGRWRTHLDDRPPHRYHRPSIDWLLESVARSAPGCALGVLLTGMGDDGVTGLRHLLEAGNHTIAQDESTSLVYGMPGEAQKQGVAGRVLPLDRIAAACTQWARGTGVEHRTPAT